MRRGWAGEGGWRAGRMVPEAGARSRCGASPTRGLGCARWRRASGARAGEAACEAQAPAATGRRRRGARRRSLTLRGERWTPDGTQDVAEPRRGALAAASWYGSGPPLPPNTQDSTRCHTCQLSHAGLDAPDRELGERSLLRCEFRPPSSPRSSARTHCGCPKTLRKVHRRSSW